MLNTTIGVTLWPAQIGEAGLSAKLLREGGVFTVMIFVEMTVEQLFCTARVIV